ncbi:AraC family transcriptional regulator [Christiangramia fulva]|uniref:AraC family transcriptional regulator n=1 Tax=Christiangramia fulva TaxID=2126553 RepID=A0A2R3Z658_9FLAO|nr:effector binding domain-containing protein [Christiangramia fulva]AVR45694.1 AraC family transcriptional regulator [Christiangramia fulva]
MKILKYLFFLFLIFIIGASIYIATKDGKYQIEQQQLIYGPREVVFNKVNKLTSWKQWEAWSQQSEDMILNYGEKIQGEGASFSWSSDELEDGSITTTNVKPFTSIDQELVLENTLGQTRSDVYWEFDTQGDSTRVTWGIKGDESFMEKVAFTFQDRDLKDIMQPLMKKSLENLQDAVRKEIQSYSINVEGITQHSGGYYLYIATGSRLSQVPKQMMDIAKQVSEYMQSNGIEKAGSPIVLYNEINFQKNTAIYSAGYFTQSEIITPAESTILSGYLPNQRMLKTTLKGDYKYLQRTWDSAYAYINRNNLELSNEGQPLEVFVTGVKDHANPAEWLTQLFIPLAPETEQNLTND